MAGKIQNETKIQITEETKEAVKKYISTERNPDTVPEEVIESLCIPFSCNDLTTFDCYDICDIVGSGEVLERYAGYGKDMEEAMNNAIKETRHTKMRVSKMLIMLLAPKKRLDLVESMKQSAFESVECEYISFIGCFDGWDKCCVCLVLAGEKQ